VCLCAAARLSSDPTVNRVYVVVHPVALCRVVSCRVVSCRVVSCRVVSCRVVSCRVVPCRVVSCGAICGLVGGHGRQIIDTVDLYRLPGQRNIALRYLAATLLKLDVQVR
jgi:hypothetical protein